MFDFHLCFDTGIAWVKHTFDTPGVDPIWIDALDQEHYDSLIAEEGERYDSLIAEQEGF